SNIHCSDQSKSTKLQVPKQRQFLATKTVQFRGGPCPGTIAPRLIDSFTINGSSNALKIPHRLHRRTRPLESRCFRNVSHNTAFGVKSRDCAPGARIWENPSQVVSKNITAGMSRGDWVPMRRSVT